jgi:ribonucleoside-triphosphate reductase
LKEKVRLATILGTFQSTLTDFKYLRKVWKENTEEERLLGVSLTGILDCYLLNNGTKESIQRILLELKEVAVDTNLQISKVLGIPQSTAITCIKPSGTVSQLVDSASGIHARHSDYYVRTVRGDNKDPLTQFMKEAGIPIEPDITKPDSVSVFSFPMKSPIGAITRTAMTAIEQLDYWLMFQRHWCEHKPSVTISVKEENEYKELMKTMPKAIDWSKLKDFEKEDTTNGSKELACTAGVCEVVDIEAS